MHKKIGSNYDTIGFQCICIENILKEIEIKILEKIKRDFIKKL
ncbi:hypothetical protein [Blattabacterium cuenoti]|nr:hypothetical protein [Blattabacterium cuenoti]